MPVKSKSKRTSKQAKAKSSRSKVKKSPQQTPTVKAIPEKQTKGQILKSISEITGLSGPEVKAVFSAASHLSKCHLTKRGSGEFSYPELGIKVVRKTKPATKKRPGRNPLTGESIMIPAKPKREVVRARLLKSLKEVVE